MARCSRRLYVLSVLSLGVALLPFSCSDDVARKMDARATDGKQRDVPIADRTGGGSPDLAVDTAPLSDTSASSSKEGSAVDKASPKEGGAVDLPSFPDGYFGDLFVPNDGGGAVALPYSIDDLVKVCVVDAACTPTSTPHSVNECLQHALGLGTPPASAYACFGKKTNGCKAMLDCTGGSITAKTCAGSSPSCAGDLYTICLGGTQEIVLDCKKALGTTCYSPTLGCSPGAACSSPSPTPTCKGSSRVQCAAGKEFLLGSCTTYGLPCRDGVCAGPGEACTGTSSSCESSAQIAFCYSGYRMRVGCSDLGSAFTCVSSSTTGARCQQATQCDPDTAKGKETCVGTQLQLCVGGKTTLFDCTSAGFTGCSGGLCTP
jgi:hypothetical protein